MSLDNIENTPINPGNTRKDLALLSTSIGIESESAVAAKYLLITYLNNSNIGESIKENGISFFKSRLT